MEKIFKYRLLCCFLGLASILSFFWLINKNYQNNPLNNYEIVYWDASFLKTINLQTRKIKRLNNPPYHIRVLNILNAPLWKIKKLLFGVKPSDEWEDGQPGFVEFYNALWTKDGNAIVYTADYCEGSGPIAQTYILKIGGKKPVYIGDTSDFSIGENDKILFRDEYSSIYEYDIKTGIKRKLIRGNVYEKRGFGSPKLLDGGNKLICVGVGNSLILYDIKTKKELKLISIAGGIYGGLDNALSPDEKRVIFVKGGYNDNTRKINILDLTTKEEQLLYKLKDKRFYEDVDRYLVEDTCGLDVLSWSPDGEKIAFVKKCDTDDKDDQGYKLLYHSDIFLIAVKTKKVRKLAKGRQFAWFPDSERLLYLTENTASPAKLILLNIKTGKEEVLTEKATDISPFAIKPIISKDNTKVQRAQKNDKK